jgi:phage terminase large subunit-like protein
MRDDLDQILPRGRRRYVLVAAPGESQSREFVRVAAGMIDGSPLLRSLATLRSDSVEFNLPSGRQTVIRALPANPRTVRGMSASLVIGDEAAHFNKDDQLVSDAAMVEALEASTSVFRVLGRMILISTPAGEVGEFYRLFTAARDGLIDRAVAIHAPAWELNPDLDSDEWRDSKRQLLGNDAFEQEHAASFISGAGAFFDLRGVAFADGPARPEEGADWVAGLDPAFHSDRYGVALVGQSR